MTPFRVAYLVSHPIQYQVPLLRRLASDPELDLTVFYMDDYGARRHYEPEFKSDVEWGPPLLDGYRWRVLRNWSPRAGVERFLGYVQPSIVGVLRSERWDALIVHGYAHATEWLGFLGAWMSGTPLFLRGESNLIGGRPGGMRAAKGAAIGAVLRRLDGALAIGARNREFYRAFGVPEDRIFFVPYAVDNDHFTAEADRRRSGRWALRERLGVPPGLPVVLFSGKLMPRKRAVDVVTAAGAIAADCPAAVVLVGDGRDRPRVEAEIARSGVRHAVITGFVNQDEIPAYYAAGDVLVLPSSYDPWGLVLNEAMCAGLPVIASDAVGAAPDLIRPGENGDVYPAGDVAALARALRGVLGDPARRAAMGARSRDIVAAYSYDVDRRGILDALRASRLRRASGARVDAKASR